MFQESRERRKVIEFIFLVECVAEVVVEVQMQFGFMMIRLEAIASRLEAIAIN